MSEQKDFSDTWKGARASTGRPGVTWTYPKIMSWKRPCQDGADGFGYIQIYAGHCGNLEILAEETPGRGRGGKSVMLGLSPEKAIELRNLLLAMHPIE